MMFTIGYCGGRQEDFFFFFFINDSFRAIVREVLRLVFFFLLKNKSKSDIIYLFL